MLILHVTDVLQISGTKFPLGGAVVAGSDRPPYSFFVLVLRIVTSRRLSGILDTCDVVAHALVRSTARQTKSGRLSSEASLRVLRSLPIFILIT